jgi:hypothetical protein
MKGLIFVALVVVFSVTGIVHANVDDFNGNALNDMWTYRDPIGNGEYTIEGGKLILDLKAGADMYIQGVDGGVLFLMDPPEMEDYTVEVKVNVAVDGFQPPASHVGPVLFNEGKWAYTAWGPYANTDTRLEDCIGGAYRWRDQTLIGINQNVVRIDSDVWTKVVKTGTSLEFFSKGDEDEDWVSGGVDETLGPNYIPGEYQVGIFFKSWGGSIDSTFEIDYFNIPEIAPVEPNGKLATTWAAVK